MSDLVTITSNERRAPTRYPNNQLERLVSVDSVAVSSSRGSRVDLNLWLG